MSPMFRSSLVAAAALFFLQLSSVQAANVLFVSDSTTDANLPGVLSADGHNVTVVNSDYSGGANATLTASLSSYDLVVWSATGGGYGGSHNAATITALESFVSGGGKVFLTGYDSLASPTDSNLIGFVGGGTVSDGGSPASAVVNQVNSLSVGVVDIRGVTPSGGYSDQDTVRNLQSGVVGVVASSSSNGYVWVLRSLGNGEIAYVSNGAHRSTSVTPSWTNTASGGAGAYNAAVRNFASSVTDNDGDGATLSEDCDDNDPNNYPGNAEFCFDGSDNDCDDTIDRAENGMSFIHLGDPQTISPGGRLDFWAPAGMDWSTAFTWEAWVKMDVPPTTDDVRLFWHRGDGGGADGAYVAVDLYRGSNEYPQSAPQLEARAANGTPGGGQSDTGLESQTPVWQHVAMSHDPSARTLQMYVDGIPAGLRAMSEEWYDEPVIPAAYMQFGGCCGPIGSLLSLDDVRLWSVTRSAEDIAATMCDTVPSTATGLVFNWDFEDPSGEYQQGDSGPNALEVAGGTNVSLAQHTFE